MIWRCEFFVALSQMPPAHARSNALRGPTRTPKSRPVHGARNVLMQSCRGHFCEHRAADVALADARK
eukprot:1789633-Lingulodinium_polyedra.AAC.1